MLHDIILGSWEFSASFCVGRSRGCEVSISTSEETRTVSKRHVGFVPFTETLGVSGFGKRRWLVYDLETMNGTAVNEVEIPTGGNRELHNGDEVVLASAMRQCVRLLVQFSDDAHSRIVVKALTRSMTSSPVPLHRQTTTPSPSLRRSPRRVVMTNALEDVTGFRRSANTIAGSPAIARTGCRVEARTPGSCYGNMMTPPPQSLSQKRSRASPRKAAIEIENVEMHRQEETPSSQLRKRLRRGGIIEEATAVKEDVSTDTKRPREHENEERERLMMCSVCLEYFHGSATLPCSHTFCGYCISSWFRSSLSCPECRAVVKTVPVRNRALDELVKRIVGHTEAYKSHVRRRTRMQRRSIVSHHFGRRSSNDNINVSEGAVRGVSNFQLVSPTTHELRIRASVFTRWSVEDKLAFSEYIKDQFGETRFATCKKVGLTEMAVDRSNMTELIVAAQNLLLDYSGIRMIGEACCQRLKIFLFFG
ncbi:unnamed protein product [Peronospora farinosa]|uniref:E3 ubiquitin-protein ligase CHFR n=2 Tax=Peronospora farinosa TaxID=134698 RepID=A0AAV0SV91_9STRA|nr:unnamed protein product [Peronospora farinosa]